MKFLCSLLLMFSFLSTSLSQELSDSLLIYYPFSENASDFSGNGFDGLLNATSVEDQFGNPNQAMSFNGINQYIDFPNDPKLKPELPVSFSFWVKFNDLDPTKTVLFTTDFGPDQHSGVWMNASSNNPKIGINYGEASGGSSSPDRRSKGGGNASLEVGVWYHVAGVVRGPLDMDIFIDCQNDGGTYNGSGSSLGYTDQPGTIGRKDLAGTPVYYFDGVIDNFRYWNRTITFEEVNILCEEVTTKTKEINKNEDRAFIYPNPTNDIINIEAKGSSFSSIEIYNLMGIRLGEYDFEEKLNVEFLSEGVYFLKLYNDEKEISQTAKFFKS